MFVCVCKKGKKIGFALSLFLSIALFYFRSLTATCRCVLFGLVVCVCDANGMKTAEFFSVALTFLFFYNKIV